MAPRPPLSGTPLPGTPHSGRDLVIVLSPFEEPGERIVVAAERAGALGLLDLGRDAGAARDALARLGRLRHGVRVPVGCPLTPAEAARGTDTVLLADPRAYGAGGWAYGAGPDGAATGSDGAVPGPDGPVPGPDDWADGGRRRVWAEITSPEEAVAACAAGVSALVARGGSRAAGSANSRPSSCSPVYCRPGRDGSVLAAGESGRTPPPRPSPGRRPGAAGLPARAHHRGAARLPARSPTPSGPWTAARPRSSRATGSSPARTSPPRGARPPEGRRRERRAADRHRPRIAALLGARDLQTQLLPIGQDGAFAARLAARHRTTGGVVQAVRTALAGHLAAAARTRPLAPRPGARHLPVAQGPMTRVSDVSAFAAVVAAEGGLPFRSRRHGRGAGAPLLAETAGRLGERPWGVGLLGFAPPELRREQLAAVAEFAPSTRSSPAAGPPRPRCSKRPGPGPTSMSRPPACWSATSPKAPGDSSSRGRSAGGTSAPGPASRCGRSRSSG
ncbi:hypothetical protein O1L68_04090 [Streptomyces lydicus]|nr:hypothetical protein [Streptomyces lydicus]